MDLPTETLKANHTITGINSSEKEKRQHTEKVAWLYRRDSTQSLSQTQPKIFISKNPDRTGVLKWQKRDLNELEMTQIIFKNIRNKSAIQQTTSTVNIALILQQMY